MSVVLDILDRLHNMAKYAIGIVPPVEALLLEAREEIAALRAHNAQLVAELQNVLDWARTEKAPLRKQEIASIEAALTASPSAALEAIRAVQRAYDATGAVWFKCTDAEMALFAKLNDEMKALAQTFGAP